MPWFYNSSSGSVAEEAGVLGFLGGLQTHFGIGWHEYSSYADVLAAVQAHPGWPQPTGSLGQATRTEIGSEARAAGSAAGISTTGLTAIGGFFSRLGQRNTWLRVIKVAIGLALVIVGLVQLTHATKVISTVGQAAAAAA